MHVYCSKCGIEDILEFSKNPDEVFLEFLTRYDKGLVTEKGLSEGLTDEGIIRSEKEIKEMIGKNNPEKFIEKISISFVCEHSNDRNRSFCNGKTKRKN